MHISDVFNEILSDNRDFFMKFLSYDPRVNYDLYY